MKRHFVNILIPLVIFSIPFLTPVYRGSLDISTLITVVSLLFAILVGFFIAAASTNYLKLQSLASDEEACLMALFNLSKLIDPSSKEKIIEAIDTYMIAIQSYEFTDYVGKSEDELDALIRAVDSINIKDEIDSALMQNLHEKKIELYSIRQEMDLVARNIITGRHWSIIVTLAIVISILLLMLNDGSIFAKLLSGALIFSLYYILLLLYELDENRFAEKELAFVSPGRVFRLIGKQPYFVDEAPKSGRFKISDKSYRLGTVGADDKIEVRVVKR